MNDFENEFIQIVEDYSGAFNLDEIELENTNLWAQISTDYYEDTDEVYDYMYDICYDFRYNHNMIDEWKADIDVYDYLEDCGCISAEICIRF